jgi:hypothetical protein
LLPPALTARQRAAKKQWVRQVTTDLDGFRLAGRYDMVNSNRNRRNQPPTGEGKHQSQDRGEPRKLDKRSEVVQAQRHHPELNLGDSERRPRTAKAIS